MQQIKICPRCQAQHNIYSPSCQCGHTFRSAPPPPIDQTTFFTPGQVSSPLPNYSNQPLRQPQPQALHQSASPHLLPELTRQYDALIKWQIFGSILLADGPILLITLMLTGLYGVLLAASIIFPVAIALMPVFGIGGFIYALGKKPILRQQVAALGIDSQQWAGPMDRKFWQFFAWGMGISVVLVILCTVIGSVTRGNGRDEYGDNLPRYNQRNSPTTYEWDYQRR
jgi:hypothetical protein